MAAERSPIASPFLPRRLRTFITGVSVVLLAGLLVVASRLDTRSRIASIEALADGHVDTAAEVVFHLAQDGWAAPGASEQLQHVVEALGQDGAVRYIVVRADDRIVAATAGADTIIAAARPTHGPDATHHLLTPVGRVHEHRRSAVCAGREFTVRIGLDDGPVHQLRQDIALRAKVRGGVVVVSAALVSVLLLMLQRHAVLNREVNRVYDRLERREEEARRTEKLAAMGSLAAGVAHQLRNPLNSIHMIAQIMESESDLDDNVRDSAGHIRRETARIDASIGQFLDFARPREPVFVPVDAAATLREVTELQATAHHGRGVELTGYAPGPVEMETDRGFLVEIIENLLRNAVEAGATKVVASLVLDTDHAEISVADDGPGVPASEREKIFDLYYTSRADGSGLGLSIVSQLAASLGGAAALAEGPGLNRRGARFTVRLPRKRRR